MIHFCTYCDHGYAARLLCLHASLRAQADLFRLFVLCFDAETEAVVRAQQTPELVAIPLSELLMADPAYAAVRSQRTPIEFFFTTTPVLVRYCLARETAAAEMTYIDSDIGFFGPPSAVWAEQGDAAVGIVPHRFPARLAARLQYGTYNVGWVSFRRDPDALACLEWWRERCLEWCYDRVAPDGRFADQGYLDEFPKRFSRVRVLDHPGINAAPWNLEGREVTAGQGRVAIDGQRLLFFHFQGIRELAPGWFEPGLRGYGVPLSPSCRDLIYRPYLLRLAAEQERLERMHAIAPRFLHERLNAGNSWRQCWERWKARWILPWRGRLSGWLVYAPAPRS